MGDKTGCILLTLWNEDIDKMENEKVYLLTNVYTSIFKGSLRLNVGRYGNMQAIDEEIPSEVNEDNNLSNEVYAQQLRRTPRYSGYRSYSDKPRRDNWKNNWSNRRHRRGY